MRSWTRLNEHADPVGIVPHRILVAFPIQNEHRLSHVGTDGIHEMVGLTGRVAAARVMVETGALATLLHASCLAGHVSVGEAGVLCGPDHGEVVVSGTSDRRGLPDGHVDAVHTRPCQRQIMHAASSMVSITANCFLSLDTDLPLPPEYGGTPHLCGAPVRVMCGLWIVPVTGLEPPSVTVGELLVANTAGSAAAVLSVGLACVELAFVLHAAHGRQEQRLR